MNYNIGLISLGCPKNLIDSEIMIGMLEKTGFLPVNDLKSADVVIVNTCAFVGDAREEAVTEILEAARLKDQGKLKVLAVTGCLAERYRDEIIKEIPEVDLVFGTGSIEKIPERIKAFLDGQQTENRIWCDIPNSVDYLEKGRVITDDKPYAYLKIAEGCSNRCTYCVIPDLRGAYRSRSIENIIKEAHFLADRGKKEIVLVAQDVTRYGMDLYGGRKLVELIQALSGIDNISWIRLLYCYPELIDDGLIDEMKNSAKLLKYLDIPIQHISDSILKAMGRRGSKDYILGLLKRLREEIPGIALRTTLIAGFPGETEEDYRELWDFVSAGYFRQLGIFSYSREEGTPAYKMAGQLPKKLKESRKNELMALQRENVIKFNDSRVGNTYDTMIEGIAEDGIFYVGRTYMEAPEIDPVVYVASPSQINIGDTVRVKMLCADEYDMIGEVEV